MLLTMTVKEALQELADAVKRIIEGRIQFYGANPRANGENTLEGSDLQKSIEVTADEDGITLQIADYWEYIARGWKKTGNSRKRGLYHALVLWALKKHIILPGMTLNESAVRVADGTWYYMIIHKRPIAPRRFMKYNKDGDLTKMLPELKGYIDKWFENLFNAIMEETDKYFN